MMYTCCYCLHKDVNTVRQYNKSFLKYMNCSVDILFVFCATQNQKKSQLTSLLSRSFFYHDFIVEVTSNFGLGSWAEVV